MLNRHSDYLVILVATYNRLSLLKQALKSIETGTRCSHEIIVIDGGSTDGTVEYLNSHPGITPVFQGALLGAARAYNQVWRQIDSQYTCWLSDDTEIVAGSLDLATRILKSHTAIGMVGLKMKDTIGSATTKPYMGACSEYGIINCNHGVLATKLLRAVGYFNECYYTYGIDPDLTASILCTGKQVVMTKQICVLHHRAKFGDRNVEIGEEFTPSVFRKDWKIVYHQKFKFLDSSIVASEKPKTWLNRHLKPILFPPEKKNSSRFGINHRDWRNIIKGKFISSIDLLKNLFRPYYLVQRIPSSLLTSDANPYRELLD
jgi:glycosyltransferase involved in cell wall biosynthesis